MKAMILAAGSGMRLRPYTQDVPKPLLLIHDKPLISYNLECLADSGFRNIMINLAHYSEKIKESLGDGEQYGLSIDYSEEPPDAFGTAGGIINVLDWFEGEPFVVVNADVICDYPLKNLELPINSLGHIILVDNPDDNPEGDFNLIDNHIVPSGGNRLTFSGIGIYHPKLFEQYTIEQRQLLPILLKAIDAGQITAEYYSGDWIGVNDEESLKRANA